MSLFRKYSYFLRAMKNWNTIMKRPISRLQVAGFLFINCTSIPNVSTDQVKTNDLNHRKSIQHACVNSINSASDLLTQMLFAIIDAASEYKKSMNELIYLLERRIELSGYPSEATEDIENKVIAARGVFNECASEFLELLTMMEYIEKLANACSEISFLTGAETLAMIISERLYSIKEKVKKEHDEVKATEKLLLNMEQLEIQGNVEDQ